MSLLGMQSDLMLQLELAALQATERLEPSPTQPEFDLETRNSITHCFAALAPRHAAQYLATAHYSISRHIQPWDFLEHNSTRNNRVCRDACNHFNHMVSWVTTSILKCEKSKSRAKRISRWIKVAEAAAEASFLSVLLMLTNALDHFTISRLRKTWDCVPQSHRDTLQHLIGLCSPHGNFKYLRDAARESGHPLPLAIVLKDILFIHEVLPSVSVQNEKIAYDRFHLLGVTLVRQTSLNKTSMFSKSLIHTSSQLTDFLMNPVPRYSDDKLYARSRDLEPTQTASTNDTGTATVVCENALVGMLRARAASRDSPPPPSFVDQRTEESSDESGQPTTPRPQTPPSPALQPASPPVSPHRIPQATEVRSENQLYLFLKQQQRLQQNLLPTSSPLSMSAPTMSEVSVSAEQPKRSLGRLSRLLKKSSSQVD